jgi:hypothetical protein
MRQFRSRAFRARTSLLVVAAVPLTIGALAIAAPASTAVRATAGGTFRNCTAMHKTYPHGVGKVGARDKTTGTPVTTFKRSNLLYRLNIRSDADHDGIACEKR